MCKYWNFFILYIIALQFCFSLVFIWTFVLAKNDCTKWLSDCFHCIGKSFTYFIFSLVRVHYLFFIWLHLFIMQKTFQKIIFIKWFCVCLFIYKHEIFGKRLLLGHSCFPIALLSVLHSSFLVRNLCFYLYFTLIWIYFYICLAINLFFIVVLPEMFFQGKSSFYALTVMKCEWTSWIKRLSIIDSDDSNCYMMLMLLMNLHLVLLNLKCYEWFLHNFSFLDPFGLLWITLQHANKSIFIAVMAIATHLFYNRHTMKKD